jgi:hypothetical protein
MRQANFSKALALLGPVVAASRNPEYRESARRLLGVISELRAATASGTAVGPRVVPIYRTLLDGERRLEGTIEAIECPRSGIVLVLRDASGSRRFAATSFDMIQFITYRDDLKGSITCGPQAPGLQVYLTFRQPVAGEAQLTPGLEGVVVAVEFLPKKQ